MDPQFSDALDAYEVSDVATDLTRGDQVLMLVLALLPFTIATIGYLLIGF